jgi:hypothetical protein
MEGDAAALAAAAHAAIPANWHGPFPANAPSLGMDLFSPGDIRPVWEANRLLAVPLLALAARIAPAHGHLVRAETLLHEWVAANPPFRGPAWACGQEAALRAMHLCLALALLDADRTPSSAMRVLLSAHARRIAATRAYAAAQDNNHAVSEPAGLFVIGLVLGDPTLARCGARGLARAVARLVAPDGAFAQPSPGYHRLLLDTLAVAEWFRLHHGAPPFAAPFADRAKAATLWLRRVMEPMTGVLPRCGAVDDSVFADLSLHGTADARGSVGRAVALFAADGSAGGALPLQTTPPKAEGPLETSSWLRVRLTGLVTQGTRAVVEPAPIPGGAPSPPALSIAFPPIAARQARVPRTTTVPSPRTNHRARHHIEVSKGPSAFGGVRSGEGQSPSPVAPYSPPPDAPPPARTWRTEGWYGASTDRFRLLLRTGAPLRFRPAQNDLLHLDLALDGAPLLIDGGTGAYNPPPGRDWWTAALAGTAGHNTIQFDGEEQMPRVGRFLFARWPRCRAVPGGAALRDATGRRHDRCVDLSGGRVVVTDRVAGAFSALVLRWRLAPGEWRLTDDGAAGPRARLRLTADAPHRLRLAQGWHSPAYGRVEPAPVLELTAAAPVSLLTTRVEAW